MNCWKRGKGKLAFSGAHRHRKPLKTAAERTFVALQRKGHR